MVSYEDIIKEISISPTVTTGIIQTQKNEIDKTTTQNVLIVTLILVIVLCVFALLLAKNWRKNKQKIYNFVSSRKNRGIFILAILSAGFSYFLKPLYAVSIGSHYVCSSYGNLTCSPSGIYASKGFPWGFGSVIIKFNAFYFILDLIFWFFIIYIILLAINLIRYNHK